MFPDCWILVMHVVNMVREGGKGTIRDGAAHGHRQVAGPGGYITTTFAPGVMRRACIGRANYRLGGKDAHRSRGPLN